TAPSWTIWLLDGCGGRPWRWIEPQGDSVTGVAPPFATVSVTVNMNLSSTSILRVNVRPVPLAVVSTTGWPGDRVEPSASVQTVSGPGRPGTFWPLQPVSANQACCAPLGVNSSTGGEFLSTVSR